MRISDWSSDVCSSDLLLPEIERHAHVEEFISSSGADIYYGGSHACYVHSLDEVHLQPLGAFQRAEAYYSLVLHEMTHWNGHESRSGRDLLNRFGSEAYAVEELIAELGAAFLCAELGVTSEPRIDHARYIESWLRVLKNDKKRSEEHTSELQSLMRISYAVFCLKKKKHTIDHPPKQVTTPQIQ